jgi:hypothetical protein
MEAVELESFRGALQAKKEPDVDANVKCMYIHIYEEDIIIQSAYIRSWRSSASC